MIGEPKRIFIHIQIESIYSESIPIVFHHNDGDELIYVKSVKNELSKYHKAKNVLFKLPAMKSFIH